MASIQTFGDVAVGGPTESGSSASQTRVHAAAAVQDRVELATVPPLSRVEQLKAHGGSYEAVLGDAIRKLRAAALQSTDPVESAYLSGLANRFQRLAEAGEPQVSAS